MSTGCASRLTLVHAAAMIGVLAFFPVIIGFVGGVPSVLIGCVLCYILTSQIAADLVVAFQGAAGKCLQFDSGLITGFPVLLGTVVTFLPAEVLDTLPVALKPILGNGFVVGVVTAMVLEQLILRQ